MVLIMLNGKVYTTEDLKPPMECITKFLEDEHDEQGRPRVKIVYIDPLDWSVRAAKLIFEHRTMIQEAELEKAEELNEQAKPGEEFEPPRLIFVLQAQEYWPGSESNPEAMAMRASKEKAFTEAGRKPYRGAFDYKRLTVATYIKCSGYGYSSRRDFLQYFNPNLPGYRFIIENYPESEREGWRERYEYRRQGDYKRQKELEYSSGMAHRKKCAMEVRISELEAIVAEAQKENQQLQKKLLKKKEELQKKEVVIICSMTMLLRGALTEKEELLYGPIYLFICLRSQFSLPPPV